MTEFLDSADLVIDASAEYGVMHLLSDLARERGIPQVYAWGVAGGWGGVVARSIPGRSPCWLCLRTAISPPQIIRTPAADKAGENVQPRGCAHRTFSAAGFDMAAIANHATRVAVQTLCAAHEGAYPDVAHDVSVLFLRDPLYESSSVPRWEHHRLEARPTCVCSV